MICLRLPYTFNFRGNFTYTVGAGNGDQVILLAHDLYCNNLTSFTINNVEMCITGYQKFHQDSAIIIKIYWNQVYPIHFHITFYYFSTFSSGTLLFYSNGGNSGFVVSTESYVHVQLTTDDASDTLIDSVKIDTVNRFNGFIIRYLTVAGNNLSEPAFTLNSVPDDHTFITTDNNSAISALHPPFSSTYNTYKGQTMYWMIRAPCRSYKNYINVLFLDLDGGNDYLTIFNGNKETSPVLLSYNKARNSYGYLTFSCTSSGQYALVRLSIDSSNNDNHGWILTYTKVEFSTPSWYGITNITGFPPSTDADSVCNTTGRTLIGYCPWSYHRVTFPSIHNVYDQCLCCR
ncbi:hypothetical protein CHS0354_037829 [Potamilus streckersoni]|uniref:Uncharacterized protein n=1 Tax=Potamilus streckersoni TaxID=2493646 RepID=A0AAE0VVZ8_9BIVA|nr:hypothetical protein CHS0354_037829 [Potamilus streckersoni]